MSTDVGFRLVRRLLTISPALENSLSEGTDLAEIPKYFSARYTHESRVLGTIVLPPHQRIGVDVDWRYFGTVHKSMLLSVGEDSTNEFQT